jgi:glycogen synthase
MKLFVALGPGDIVGAAFSKQVGNEIPLPSIKFSEQLFSYCKLNRIETLGVSSHHRRERFRDGMIWIENQPKILQGRRGLSFHLATLHYACYLAFRAKRFGANLAIIDSGTTHYFLLAMFRLLGIRVAVNLHNVLWPVGFPPQKKVHRIIRSLNAWFFRNMASGAIGVSPECERQILSESRNSIPFFQYRCQYLAEGFQPSKAYKAGTFRIACVGRAEESKGFIDITKISERLQSKSPVPVVFDMCGDGPAIPALQKIVREKNLTNSVVVHGHLERKALLNIYANSHAVIVPTRSTFAEGMPQVCAEAVLSGLPVITSPVSNAFDVIGPAIIRAETDNIESYVDAILKLVGNRELYIELRGQCPALSEQFLDPSQSYAAAVERLILTLFPKRA